MQKFVSSKQIKMGIELSLRNITILQAKIAEEEYVLQEWQKALKAYQAHLEQMPAPLKGCY